MTTAEMFPGFASHRIDTLNGTVFARTSAPADASNTDKPALLCLHGYPQTHVCWHKMAPELASHHNVVLIDLPGYGESDAPQTDADHTPYSKRAMAAAANAVMQHLGHERYAILSHDRGGRVGYRLTLDHPTHVTKLITLDIVTTEDAWSQLDDRGASGKFHWVFLDRPAPLPEKMIGADPDFWFEYLLASWSGTDDLAAFTADALDHYRRAWRQESYIHATCEDYRAGSSIDRAHDQADLKAGNMIACPMLALWGGGRSVGSVEGKSPLDTWRKWCPHVEGQALPCGHFIPEEAPEAALGIILPFLAPNTS